MGRAETAADGAPPSDWRGRISAAKYPVQPRPDSAPIAQGENLSALRWVSIRGLAWV